MPAAEHWDATGYADNARFVTDLGGPVLDLLAAQPGERILDLGCGDGIQMAELLSRGVDVIGVDSSANMVAAAQARGLDARQIDAAHMSFSSEFDAVFSNAALHWMTDPDAVISAVKRALRPGGRFVAEMGGHGNVAAIHTALVSVLRGRGIDTDLSDIWYFPDPEDYAACLRHAGFQVKNIDLIPRPTPIASGLHEWLRNLSAAVLHKLPESAREAAMDEVVSLLQPALRTKSGHWVVDYQRLRVRAVL